MLKVKLIENPEYYKLVTRQLLFFLVPTFPLVLILGHFDYPIWGIVLLLIFDTCLLIWIRKTQKKIVSFSENSFLEIGEDMLQLHSKDSNMNLSIDLSKVDSIHVKNSYGIPADSLGELKDEIAGHHKKNYLIVEKDKDKQRFDFILDSYYSIKQLEKLIESWRKNHFPVQFIE